MARTPKIPAYTLYANGPKRLGRCRWPLGQGRYRTQYFPGAYDSPESRAAYDQAIAAWLGNGRPAPVQQPKPTGPVTVAQLAVAFLDHVEAHGLYRKGGRRTSEYDCCVAAFRSFKVIWSGLRAADLTLRHFDQLEAHMRTITYGQYMQRKWSPTTIRKQLARVRSLVRWGEGQGLVPVGTVAAIAAAEGGLGSGTRRAKAKPRRTARKRPPDLAVVDKVAAAAPTPVGDMLRLQLLNGFRSGGLCALRPCDIEPAGDLWRYSEPDELAAKTGREVHWLGPEAQGILRPYLERCRKPTDRVFKPSVRPGACTAPRFTVTHYYRTVVRLCDRLGLPHFHPHQLRHLHLTDVRARYGLDAAQARGTHARADTTEIYSHGLDELAKKVAREIG